MQYYTLAKTVISNRTACEGMADRLHLDHSQVSLAWQLPEGQQTDSTDAGTEVEQPACLSLGSYPRPCSQQVVGGEPMAAAKLKDPPAPSQCIESDIMIFLILQAVTHVRLA